MMILLYLRIVIFREFRRWGEYCIMIRIFYNDKKISNNFVIIWFMYDDWYRDMKLSVIK